MVILLLNIVRNEWFSGYVIPKDQSSRDVFVNIWIAFQLLVDTSFLVRMKNMKLRFINEVKEKTVMEKENIQKFILLWSHTTKNLFSGILCSLSSRKPKLTLLEREYLDMSVATSRCSYRTVYNLLTYEKMRTGGTFSYNRKGRFNAHSLVDFVVVELKREVELLVAVNYSMKQKDVFPRFCEGENAVMKYMIENAIWGLLMNGIPKFLEGQIHYDGVKEVFHFEIHCFNKSSNFDCTKMMVDMKDDETTSFSILMCWRVVTELGGRFRAWTCQGGMCLALSLPLPAVFLDEPDNTPPMVLYDDSPVPLKILLVEDNVVCRSFVTKFIQQCGMNDGVEHEIQECENGYDGFVLLKCRRFHPDLVITDYDMPVYNGETFASKVRSEHLLRNEWCDIVLLTGATFSKEKTSDFLYTDSKDGIFDDIVPKPVGFESVECLIDKCMKKKKKSMMHDNQVSVSPEDEFASDVFFNNEGVNYLPKHSENEEEDKKKEVEVRRISMVAEFLNLMKQRHQDGYVVGSIVVGLLMTLLGKPSIWKVLFVGYVSTSIAPILISRAIPALFKMLCSRKLDQFLQSHEDIGDVYILLGDILGRIVCSTWISLSLRRTLSVGVVDSYSRLRRSRWFFSMFAFVFIILLEICLVIADPSFLSQKNTCEWKMLIDLVIVLRGFNTIKMISKEFKKVEKKKKIGLKKLIRQKERFTSIIENSSKRVAQPLACVEHYSKKFSDSLFSTSRGYLEEEGEEIWGKSKEEMVFFSQNLGNFRNDYMNLMLVDGLKHPNSRKIPISRNFIIPTNLQRTISEVLKKVTECYISDPLSPGIRILFNKAFDTEPTYANISPYVLEIMISNLVLNAIQNTRSKGLIKIRTDMVPCGSKHGEEETYELIFSVEDNGFGMDEKDVAFHNEFLEKRKIYEPIYEQRSKIENDFEVLSERSIKTGEETGNPKLGIGFLCCQKMRSAGLCNPGSELEVLSRGRNMGTRVTFGCRFKKMFSKKRKKFLRKEELNVLIYYDVPVIIDLRRTQEMLVELGCNPRRITAVIADPVEAKKRLLVTKFDIVVVGNCVFDEKMGRFRNRFLDFVEEDRCLGSEMKEGLCVFVTTNCSFECQGGLVDICTSKKKGKNGSPAEGIVCLAPIRKFDLSRILDFYLM